MSRNYHLSEERKVCAFLCISLLCMSVVSSACVVINNGLNPPFSDLNPPSWRGQDGSTFARWEFTDSSLTPQWDEGRNYYGQTIINVYPASGHSWVEQKNGAIGIWPLCGRIVVDIDNRPTEGPEKWIQIQLVWTPKYGVAKPGISITDNQNLKRTGFVPSIEMSMPDRLQWTYSVYNVIWPYNPTKERIEIFNSIYVDALIIDTLCLPEPSTYCILAAGAVFFYRVRKK